MLQYIIKITITAVLVVAISEVAKRSSFAGAVLASVPLISVLALFWLYFETKDLDKVSELSTSVFWLVLPSLALFVALPLMLKQGINFYFSLGFSIALTIFCYWLMVTILTYFEIDL
jgi:hypothetical protein